MTRKAVVQALVLLPTFVGLLGLQGCVGPGIAAQADVVRVDIAKAKKSGAYECAPVELAKAEAHVDFAEAELAEGDFIRAKEHMEIAIDEKIKALENSKGCAPKDFDQKEFWTPMETAFTTNKTLARRTPKTKTSLKTKTAARTLITIKTPCWIPWMNAPTNPGPQTIKAARTAIATVMASTTRPTSARTNQKILMKIVIPTGAPTLTPIKTASKMTWTNAQRNPKTSMGLWMRTAAPTLTTIKTASSIPWTNVPSRPVCHKQPGAPIWTAIS